MNFNLVKLINLEKINQVEFNHFKNKETNKMEKLIF